MTPPRLTHYLDFRRYLKDWLAYKKHIDPSYSHGVFGKASGLARSTLHNVLYDGRTPKPETLDKFARAIGLCPSERMHLGLLVELNTASSIEQRRQIVRKITEQPQTGHSEWIEDRPDVFEIYLSRWYYPVVRELARHPSFRADPRWLARTLVPAVTEEEAAEALQTLQDLSLLDLRDGKVEVRSLRVQTRPDTEARASAEFHKRMVPAILDRMEDVPAELRHLMATVVSLPTELLPEVKLRIVRLIQQISDLADDPAAEERRAYQLAVQLIPVSRALVFNRASRSEETPKA
ncbi:MAG: TIGR02147 family protein [Myxococcota bacterium]